MPLQFPLIGAPKAPDPGVAVTGDNRWGKRSSVNDAVYYVMAGGSDLNSGLSPGDAFASVQTALNALDIAIGGTIYVGPGTFTCNAVISKQSDTAFIRIIGSGRELTTLVSTVINNYTLRLLSSCYISDMTVDDGGFAVSTLMCLSTNSIMVEKVIIERVLTKKTRADGVGWSLVIWDSVQNLDALKIRECHLNEVEITGGGTAQDAFATAYVDTVFVNNITFRDCPRTPNFYAGNRVIGSGIYVKNVPSSSGSLVFDSRLKYVDVDNIFIDSDCGVPLFNAWEQHYSNSTFLVGLHVKHNTTGGTMNVTSFTGCRLRRVILQKPTTSLNFSGCTFIGVDGDGAGLIADNIPPADGGLVGMSVVGCIFDSRDKAGNWIASVQNANWTDVQAEGNVILGLSTTVDETTGTKTRVRFTNNLGATSNRSATITPDGSPYTYTNDGVNPEIVYIYAGTVSSVVVNGVTIATSTGTSVRLNPGEAVVVTYSVAPTMRRVLQL